MAFGHKPKSKALNFVYSTGTDLIFLSFLFFPELFVPTEEELNTDFRLALAKLLLVPFAEWKCSKVNSNEAQLEARFSAIPAIFAETPVRLRLGVVINCAPFN